MLKKIYCGGAFDFDCRDIDYQEAAKKDYRVVSVLKNLDTFLRACAVQHLSDKLDYIGPFYYETEDMKGEDIVAKELEMIEDCTDAIFILDRAGCPGTISECTYAASLGKKLHIFYTQEGENQETESDLHTPCWFAIYGAIKINPQNTYLYEVNNKNMLYSQVETLINSLK